MANTCWSAPPDRPPERPPTVAAPSRLVTMFARSQYDALPAWSG